MPEGRHLRGGLPKNWEESVAIAEREEELTVTMSRLLLRLRLGIDNPNYQLAGSSRQRGTPKKKFSPGFSSKDQRDGETH